MTWLGKILAFLVLVGAGVWAYFTVQTFVTRANWKAELERVKAINKEWDTAYRTEVARSAAREDAYKRLLTSEQERSSGLQKQVDIVSRDLKKTTKDFTDLQVAYEKEDVKHVEYKVNLDNTLVELTKVRDRNSGLEDERVKLVIAREDALRDKVRAENAAKLALAIADDNAKKVEELAIKLTELKQFGSGNQDLTKRLDKPPPAVLANLRGEVVRVAGDLVQISIGVDAGVSKGTVLDVVRLDGGGRYVGTLKITDVYPKEAVGVFTPARGNVAFNQLRPEELPKKFDEVRPPEGGTSNNR